MGWGDWVGSVGDWLGDNSSWIAPVAGAVTSAVAANQAQNAAAPYQGPQQTSSSGSLEPWAAVAPFLGQAPGLATEILLQRLGTPPPTRGGAGRSGPSEEYRGIVDQIRNQAFNSPLMGNATNALMGLISNPNSMTSGAYDMASAYASQGSPYVNALMGLLSQPAGSPGGFFGGSSYLNNFIESGPVNMFNPESGRPGPAQQYTDAGSDMGSVPFLGHTGRWGMPDFGGPVTVGREGGFPVGDSTRVSEQNPHGLESSSWGDVARGALAATGGPQSMLRYAARQLWNDYRNRPEAEGPPVYYDGQFGAGV